MDMSLKSKSFLPETLEVNLEAAGPTGKSCIAQINTSHVLQNSEKNFNSHQLNLSMQMLRNREGLHAPIKLSMEMMAAKKIGRHPFLQSSNAQLHSLLGTDELIQFSDFLGIEENFENMRNPHAVVEKSLGIF